jgi:hypothetical protein
MNTYKHFFAMLGLVVVTSLSSGVVAEVGVVTKQGTDIVATGPYLMSIIEDSEPVGLWARHTTPSGTTMVLNESGSTNGDGLPSMAVDSGNSLPIVTWGRNNGSGFDIVESHFENGAWTTPVVLAAGVTTSIDPEPFVTLDRQTLGVHIVYVTNDSAPVVMHTEAPADLSSWTSPNMVSEIGENGLRPSAIIHQGTLTVAYESHVSGVGNTPRVITVATSDGLGGFTYETITSSQGGSPNRPQLHVGMGSSMWIDWVDDMANVAWAIRQPGTGWGSVQIEPFTDSEDRDYHVRGRIKQLASQ